MYGCGLCPVKWHKRQQGLDNRRSFRWGHVRQLDRVKLLARAWAAGAGGRRVNRINDNDEGDVRAA